MDAFQEDVELETMVSEIQQHLFDIEGHLRLMELVAARSQQSPVVIAAEVDSVSMISPTPISSPIDSSDLKTKDYSSSVSKCRTSGPASSQRRQRKGKRPAIPQELKDSQGQIDWARVDKVLVGRQHELQSKRERYVTISTVFAHSPWV